MEQNIKKIVILSVLFVVSVIFSRCQNDEYLSKTESTNLASAKTWFDDYKAKENFHPAFKNIEYHWEIASMVKLENDSEAIVVPMKDSPENPDYKGKKILYLYLADSGYEAVVHEIFSKSEDVSFFVNEKQDFQNLDSFNGYILTWNLKEGFVKGAEFENGLIVKNISSAIILSDDEKVKAYNQTRKAPPTAPLELDPVIVTGGTGGGGCAGCGGVIRFTPTLGGGSIGGGTGGYIGSPNGGGSSIGGGGISAPSPKQIAAALQKQIDGNALDPCTKAVLDKLKILTENNIASIFEKFGVPANATYNLKIIIGTPNSPGALADTRSVSKNNYLITIRDSYIKGGYNNGKRPTDLAIASILIHEIIHAHFFALFDDFHNNGDICAYDKYDCLFMEYGSKNFEGTTDSQHLQMFENYLDVMANALQEFQTGIAIPNAGKAELFYHDLALSTLGGTQIFKDRYPLNYNSPTYEERRRIVNNRAAEDNNETIDDAEKGKYIPKGKSCTN